MSRALEERIAVLAARQHGVVTHAQLLQAGLTPWAISRRSRGGRLRTLHRGVYLVGPVALSRTSEMAAVLACGPGAVLSHASAAALWAMRAAEQGRVDVTVAACRRTRSGIRLHRVRRLGDEERRTVEGIPVTCPARTIADLAGIVTRPELERIVALAEREGLVTAEELAELLARSAGHRGAGALRAVLRLPGGPALTRSTAEREFLALIREADLPRPECNVSIGRYEVDFLWRGAGLAVEVDGYGYHASRPRFEGDRRKDAELVAAGLTVLRLSWRQITSHPLSTVARLAPALARAPRQLRRI